MKKLFFVAAAALPLLTSCQVYQPTGPAPPMARDRDEDATCKAAGTQPGMPYYEMCRGAV